MVFIKQSKYYPDPDTFDFERFSDLNTEVNELNSILIDTKKCYLEQI
jgi:hypothetical protein